MDKTKEVSEVYLAITIKVTKCSSKILIPNK